MDMLWSRSLTLTLCFLSAAWHPITACLSPWSVAINPSSSHLSILFCKYSSLCVSLFPPFVTGRIHQIDWKYWRCVAGGPRSCESMETLSDSSSSGCLPERTSRCTRQPLPRPMVNGLLQRRLLSVCSQVWIRWSRCHCLVPFFSRV